MRTRNKKKRKKQALKIVLAVHASLRHANESLRPGEYLFAFLDDVYTVTSKNRATAVAHMVAKSIHDHAGVEPKLGKFQIWG